MQNLSATVQPCKCDNPEHPKGCPFGYKLIHCEEEEAHTWVGSITVDNVCLWSTNQMQSQSREAATAALLSRLAEGVSFQ
jgi:hypothetical protein